MKGGPLLTIRYRSAGACIEAVWRTALEEWAKQEHRALSLPDAIALHMEHCELTTKMYPGGRIDVMCSVADKDPVKSHGEFRRFHRKGPKAFYPAPAAR